MSFRLYNVRGGPTTEVQHTAAYCGTMLHTGLDPCREKDKGANVIWTQINSRYHGVVVCRGCGV